MSTTRRPAEATSSCSTPARSRTSPRSTCPHEYPRASTATGSRRRCRASAAASYVGASGSSPAPSVSPPTAGRPGPPQRCDIVAARARRLLTRCVDLCWHGDAVCGGVAVEAVEGGELCCGGGGGVFGLGQEAAGAARVGGGG